MPMRNGLTDSARREPVRLRDLMYHGDRGNFAHLLYQLYRHPDSRTHYSVAWALADDANRAALEAALEKASYNGGSQFDEDRFVNALEEHFSGLTHLDETEDPHSIPIRTPEEV